MWGLLEVWGGAVDVWWVPWRYEGLHGNVGGAIEVWRLLWWCKGGHGCVGSAVEVWEMLKGERARRSLSSFFVVLIYAMVS